MAVAVSLNSRNSAYTKDHQRRNKFMIHDPNKYPNKCGKLITRILRTHIVQSEI